MAKAKKAKKEKTEGRKAESKLKARPAWMGEEEEIELPTDDGGGFLPEAKVLQLTSNELDSGHDRFIRGAVAGEILVTGEEPIIYDGDDGVIFTPLMARKLYKEFKPNQGGFVAEYNSREELNESFTAGNDVQVSLEYLAIVETGEETKLDDGTEIEGRLCVIRFNSPTKMAAHRKFAALMQQHKTMIGLRCVLTSESERNKANQKYYKMMVDVVGWTDKALYKAIEATILPAQEHQFLPPGQNGESEI